MRLLEKIKARDFPWSIVSMIVLAVNSYIVMLYCNRDDHDITYVVVAMLLIYLIVMPLLAYRLKARPRRKRIMERVNKGFRVFYTGLSLTVIVLNMIRSSTVGTDALDQFAVEQQGKMPLLILSAVMGFSCFWSPRLVQKGRAAWDTFKAAKKEEKGS